MPEASQINLKKHNAKQASQIYLKKHNAKQRQAQLI